MFEWVTLTPFGFCTTRNMGRLHLILSGCRVPTGVSVILSEGTTCCQLLPEAGGVGGGYLTMPVCINHSHFSGWRNKISLILKRAYWGTKILDPKFQLMNRSALERTQRVAGGPGIPNAELLEGICKCIWKLAPTCHLLPALLPTGQVDRQTLAERARGNSGILFHTAVTYLVIAKFFFRRMAQGVLMNPVAKL